ncbi:MAG: hypothetical protein HQL87_18780 [Magnetococcales bacterium]|nr:hypothetical protein [Magnetococcales bacterium]
MDGKWTKEMVADRLEEAASTIRRLPVAGLKPKEYGSTWPDVILDAMEAYGRDEPVIRLGPPPADAITRMDEAMEWLRWLEPDEVRLVWMRATRTPWKMIMRYFGIARSTASARWTTAIMQVTAILNLPKGKNVQTSFCRTRVNLFQTGNDAESRRYCFCLDISDWLWYERLT